MTEPTPPPVPAPTAPTGAGRTAGASTAAGPEGGAAADGTGGADIGRSATGRRRRRRPGRRATVTAVVLAVALLAALVLAGYLWRATTAWQEHAATWEGSARDHAAQVADLQARLEGAQTDLSLTQEQLETATARITALADEKAQLGDEQVVAEQYLDYQRRVSEAAGVVATALGQCTSAQSQLIGYLGNREAYDPADLDRFAADVQALCDEANDANTQLQQELAG
ncbi:hypothetical protein ATJ88_1567 [Isoptericola jiangsuensis]|uniref:Uncharacterized protein n=1 Tax=Isoptericola jiangsuensis TaxID=548579 RepID=A0A2A9EV32_9MICO|nr:hypothetical protein [Isoptericola jiangsuensis]PFG42894.1 hypothetical protein ATJ88_1567 [Isoptericola jiangsuensis]